MNVDEKDEDEGEDGLNLALPAKVPWRPRRCDFNKEAAAMKLLLPPLIATFYPLSRTLGANSSPRPLLTQGLQKDSSKTATSFLFLGHLIEPRTKAGKAYSVVPIFI